MLLYQVHIAKQLCFFLYFDKKKTCLKRFLAKRQVTHLQLLLYHLHVVPLKKVLLLQTHPVQLRQQVGEQHSGHGVVVGRRVPDRQRTDKTHITQSTNKTAAADKIPLRRQLPPGPTTTVQPKKEQ